MSEDQLLPAPISVIAEVACDLKIHASFPAAEFGSTRIHCNWLTEFAKGASLVEKTDKKGIGRYSILILLIS